MTDVRNALDGFEAAGGESEAREAMLRMLDVVDAPADRATFEPGHLTASAVVRDPSKGKVALIHHEKLNRWLQPGGHIEPDDASLEDAARREVLEETSLEDLISHGVIDLDIHEIPARPGEPAHLHYDIRYLFDVAGNAQNAAAGDGASDIRWVDVSDLVDLDTDESVIRLVRKALDQM